MLDFGEDAINWFNSYLFPLVLGQPKTDEDARKWVEEVYWKKVAATLEKRLAMFGKPFVAGTDKPTIADFKLFSCPATVLKDMNSASIIADDVLAQCQVVIDAHPLFKQWLERMKTECNSHLQVRPPRPG